SDLTSILLLLRLSPPSFSCTAPSSTDIYTLSLHDALPIFARFPCIPFEILRSSEWIHCPGAGERLQRPLYKENGQIRLLAAALRSEEHSSELQSRFDLVCRLLLEKKKLSHCYGLIPKS